jgi:hypothetical protein
MSEELLFLPKTAYTWVEFETAVKNRIGPLRHGWKTNFIRQTGVTFNMLNRYKMTNCVPKKCIEKVNTLELQK